MLLPEYLRAAPASQRSDKKRQHKEDEVSPLWLGVILLPTDKTHVTPYGVFIKASANKAPQNNREDRHHDDGDLL
uniref:Uncharacterized protein n=1 Tax=Knipowitschia caucasica TaxID=637954 RepID=A0AAV2LDX2_KNICA